MAQTIIQARASQKKYRNAHPERCAVAVADYHERLPGSVAITKIRHRVGPGPIVSWANKFFLNEAYLLARLRTKITGIRWVVDHIVPLESPLVCGLHNEHNVQVLTYKENVGKGNRVWPDMPNHELNSFGLPA